MNKEKFKTIIKERIYVEEISKGEWQEGIEKCWQQMVDVLCEDISSSIEYLKKECTADEYSWISEVLEEIVSREGGKMFLRAYEEVMQKFPEECEKYNIIGSIAFAKSTVSEGNDA